ncbi:hypothetical protein [Bradyrhizobium arachidis]|uniref:hypothetical protein n=1 Tax=Bradyrhizobium arachidis TaxID=858423 RepID=UPI0008DF8E33|nr:hypothetical protein [Bradyrhizobium arachidis]SFU59248.1 hypothetical protein SAMN05192541_10312 [Bradyrhizobium arachidis]
MKIELHNLPPDLAAPPPDAKGWLAYQPSTRKVWWKIDGEWTVAHQKAAVASHRGRPG